MRAVLLASGPASRVIAARLSELPGIHLHVCRTAEEAAAELTAADALLLQQSLYPGQVEEAAAASSKLRWIQLLSAGYDKVAGRRIPDAAVVTGAGPSFAGAVADHATALLLSLTRGLDRAIANQAGCTWQPAALGHAICLEGKSALVVGFGSIGQRVAARLRGFGMEIAGVNRTGAAHPLADRMNSLADLDEALAAADAIVTTLPLTDATQGLFDRRRFACCNTGAFFVNVGRGPVVDFDALSEALDGGRLAGAGLDVTDPEPLPPSHPAWTARNLVITPHVGGTGAGPELANFVAANFQAFAAGRQLAGRIDLGRD